VSTNVSTTPAQKPAQSEQSSEIKEQTPEEMFAAHQQKMRLQRELHDFDKRVAKCSQRTLSDWLPVEEDSP